MGRARCAHRRCGHRDARARTWLLRRCGPGRQPPHAVGRAGSRCRSSRQGRRPASCGRPGHLPADRLKSVPGRECSALAARSAAHPFTTPLGYVGNPEQQRGQVVSRSDSVAEPRAGITTVPRQAEHLQAALMGQGVELLSEQGLSSEALDEDCLASRVAQPLSHGT